MADAREVIMAVLDARNYAPIPRDIPSDADAILRALAEAGMSVEDKQKVAALLDAAQRVVIEAGKARGGAFIPDDVFNSVLNAVNGWRAMVAAAGRE